MLDWEIGDCVELMKPIESDSIDFMITDPPYGINYVSNRCERGKEHGNITNDNSVDSIFNKKWLSQASRILKPTSAVMIFTRWDVWNEWCELISLYWNIKNMIVWVKNNHSAGDLIGNVGAQHELIVFATRGDFKIHGNRLSNVWKFNKVPADRHPTEKPVGIIKRGIELCTDKNDLVIDPFLGSGTTLEACNHTARNCIGFEIEVKYKYLYNKRAGSQMKKLSDYI
jgi:site-specific DNA-methyltransferase (adenine-specific)